MGVSERQARIGVDIATGLVVASVAVALAGLTWRIAGDAGDVVAPAPIAAVNPVAPGPADLGGALALAPFGRSAVAAGPTSLGVELRGILLADPRSASTVLIGTPGGPTVAYTMGQTITGGATIDAIAIDHVALRVADRLETLSFPKPGAGTTQVATATLPAVPLTAPPQPLQNDRQGLDVTPTPPSGEISASQIEAFMKARPDMAQAARQLQGQ